MFTEPFDTWADDAMSSWLDEGALVRTSSRTGTVKSLVLSAAAAAALTSPSVQSAQLSRVSETPRWTDPPTNAVVQGTRHLRSFSIGPLDVVISPWDLAEQPSEPAITSGEVQTFRPTSLNANLKTLRDMGVSHIPDGPAISNRSVRVARIVSHQLPVQTVPTIGVDAEGNVFLRFKNHRAEAFLTIEPHAMHLFCKVAGQPNIYIDDEPFAGRKLPTRIRKQLLDLFAT